MTGDRRKGTGKKKNPRAGAYRIRSAAGRKTRTGTGKNAAAVRRYRTFLRAGMLLLAVLTAVLVVRGCRGSGYRMDVDATEPAIDVQLLDINPYSRPGTASSGINGIVIHYTANPGSSAQDNRDYFNGLQYSHATSASSNFIVGLEGEIIQCVPTWEVAYASNDRNNDTVSIEVCHPDESGKFTEKTYRSLVQLTAWLCVKFDLESDDVIRHYDVTGKNCPKYFVEHEDAWEEFKANVRAAIQLTN